MNGVLIINKPSGYTSRDVVNIVSKKLHTKKVGHTGTLDPMAEGVLVICVGDATKLVEILTSEEKTYEAEITLGIQTDTMDITGNILKTIKPNVTKEQIIETLKHFETKYNQKVPIYSAIRINGKKLYEYARENEMVELPTREVNIKKIELISDIKKIDEKIIFKIKTTVSKGTYIRSLVNDIAESLNTVGTMSKLIRIQNGKFLIENSIKVDEFINNDIALISIEDVLKDIYKIETVRGKEALHIANGMPIDNVYNEDILVFKNQENVILGIYKKDNNILKPWKIFRR